MDEEKLACWSKRIKEWQASGLSQRAYCRREELKFGTFDYWRRRVRANPMAVEAERKPGSVTADKLTLVPVRLAGQAKSDSIVPRSPGGWQLTIPASMDTQWLASFMLRLS